MPVNSMRVQQRRGRLGMRAAALLLRWRRKGDEDGDAIAADCEEDEREREREIRMKDGSEWTAVCCVKIPVTIA